MGEDEKFHGTRISTFGVQGAATKDGKPFVITTINDVPSGQLTPEEATALGLRAIQAAIEAERDAGMVSFLKTVDGMDEEMIGMMLTLMRDHREQYDPPEGLGN